MRAPKLEALLIAAAVLMPGAAHAGWREAASAFDLSRMERFADARARGLEEVQRAGAGDLAIIRTVLEPQGRAVSPDELMGRWRCRIMKLGGITPAIVYDWFECRVREANGMPYFEKLSGTQRVSGYLYPHDSGGVVLLGAMTVGKEPQRLYSGAEPAAGAEATHTDQIGLLTAIGPGHARIEFPWPVLESDFDVIELRR